METEELLFSFWLNSLIQKVFFFFFLIENLCAFSRGTQICRALEVETGEGNGTPLHTLACKIPGMEEPGGLQSMGS